MSNWNILQFIVVSYTSTTYYIAKDILFQILCSLSLCLVEDSCQRYVSLSRSSSSCLVSTSVARVSSGRRWARSRPSSSTTWTCRRARSTALSLRSSCCASSSTTATGTTWRTRRRSSFRTSSSWRRWGRRGAAVTPSRPASCATSTSSRSRPSATTRWSGSLTPSSPRTCGWVYSCVIMWSRTLVPRTSVLTCLDMSSSPQVPAWIRHTGTTREAGIITDGISFGCFGYVGN